MASLIGSAASAAPLVGAGLGVDTAMPMINTPASVTPLSQQIAGIQQPLLTTPTLGGETQMPSLGVDLSMPVQAPEIKGPSFMDSLGTNLQGLAQIANQSGKPTQPRMQSIITTPMQQYGVQQGDLLALLRNLGGMQ